MSPLFYFCTVLVFSHLNVLYGMFLWERNMFRVDSPKLPNSFLQLLWEHLQKYNFLDNCGLRLLARCWHRHIYDSQTTFIIQPFDQSLS